MSAGAKKQIANVLEQLPGLLPEARKDIDQHAHCLASIGVLTLQSDAPRMRYAGSPAAISSLCLFADLVQALQRHIWSMPRDALEGMEAERRAWIAANRKAWGPELSEHMDALVYSQAPTPPILLATKLERLVATAHLASIRLENYPTKAEGPKKARAAEITQVAAFIFARLTGKKPTLSSNDGRDCGPFIDFLEKLFSILGVKARPGAQARQLMKKRAAKKRLDSPLEA